MNWGQWALTAFFALSLNFHFANAESEESCIQRHQEIEAKLACISGLGFTEVAQRPPKPYRVFEITFEQPVDHTDANAGQFRQRLVLLHRDVNEPMVLQTSGYSIFGVREAAITALFQTNQLQVEHRFFSASAPTPLDWTKLNIKQSADDFHRITVAFKKIYSKRWVNTGASKGGMTSIYHRRFYPDDLDGTIADVAPLSFSKRDQRYNDFIASVGGEKYKKCREDLKRAQITLLQNRDPFINAMTGEYQLLGKSTAYEHWAIEGVFYFWQYGNPEDAQLGCEALARQQSLPDLYAFMNRVSALDGYADENISQFIPYFYQAVTELGGPDNLTSHLETIRLHAFEWEQYIPKGIPHSYSNQAMREVDQWVRTQADDVLFVYGEFDPWTAGEFPVSETGRNVVKLTVPAGNHGANFTKLASNDKQQAMALISGWLNKAPLAPTNFNNLNSNELETLEDLEFRFRRRFLR